MPMTLFIGSGAASTSPATRTSSTANVPAVLRTWVRSASSRRRSAFQRSLSRTPYASSRNRSASPASVILTCQRSGWSIFGV